MDILNIFLILKSQIEEFILRICLIKMSFFMSFQIEYFGFVNAVK